MASRKKKSRPKAKKKQKKSASPRLSSRAQGRVPSMELQVEYRVKENFVVDLVNDISPGGIFIQTESPLPKGTRVELRFGKLSDPPSNRQVFVEGKVVWNHKSSKDSKKRNGMGIEFTRVDIEGQLFIDNVINDFLRKVSVF
jgi:uncharacterized protein (TIGR02266 family)